MCIIDTRLKFKWLKIKKIIVLRERERERERERQRQKRESEKREKKNVFYSMNGSLFLVFGLF